MTTDRLIAKVRRHLGVRANEVPNVEIQEHLVSSLTWLAAELEFDIHTESIIGLEAGQLYVPLPSGLMVLVFVELDDRRLEAISFSELDREGSWTTVDASTPGRYAVQGRNLILNPPPDAALIASDSTLTWCWIGSGRDLSGAGPQGLSDADQDLLAYDTALSWLADHPSESNQQKIVSYTAQVNRRLPAARKRWQQPIDTNFPQIVPDSTGRGAAR